MSSPVRENVLRMTPYSPGKPIAEVQRELGLDRVVKLASNENPLGPSPLAIEAVRAAASSMHVYPDGAAFELRAAIAAHFSVPFGQVIVGNGSDELIHMLGQVLLDGPQDNVVVGYPSFVRYDAAAQLTKAELRKVPLTADYRHDLPAMARACDENTKIVFIANPNNPTGTTVTRAEVDALLQDLPENATLVLDEAYFEFAAGAPDMPNSVDYVLEGRPVVGLRTFSKAYGLAGIRLGYAFVPGYFADGFDRAREPFDVNVLAQVAGIAALKDQDHLMKTLEINRQGAERISAAIERVGGKPYPSYANFVWADMGREAKPIFEALLQKGVIIRSGHVLGNPHCIRVSVGATEEVSIFTVALESVCAAVSR